MLRGGSRIFSRGGGGGGGGSDFQKIFENFDDLFLGVDQIDCPSSPKNLKRRCFDQIFCAAGKFLKKQVKKAII